MDKPEAAGVATAPGFVPYNPEALGIKVTGSPTAPAYIGGPGFVQSEPKVTPAAYIGGPGFVQSEPRVTSTPSAPSFVAYEPKATGTPSAPSFVAYEPKATGTPSAPSFVAYEPSTPVTTPVADGFEWADATVGFGIAAALALLAGLIAISLRDRDKLALGH